MLGCSHRIMFVLDMHTSLRYCASLHACSKDHLLCYVIFVVISKFIIVTAPMIHDRGSDMRKRERALCYINYDCFAHSSGLFLAI